jgi:hypothetical protein
MFQASNNSNTMEPPNYCVTEGRDGNPKLISCSPPGGYSTVAAAKEAEIKEKKRK